MPNIHKTSVVAKEAELGHNVTIGPYVQIGPKVMIGDNVLIESHAIITGRTKIDSGNTIGPFATIGMRPQDLKYKGEDSELTIGKNNTFREYSNVSIGTDHGGGITKIGSNNLFMMSSHIAHDCIIKDNCIFANSATLAGHVEVDDKVIIGGLSAVHQFVKIGKYAFLGGGSIVLKDIAPYSILQGNPAKVRGLNLEGLKRSDMSSERVKRIKEIYKLIFKKSLTIEESIKEINEQFKGTDEALTFLDFISRSTRGLIRE